MIAVLDVQVVASSRDRGHPAAKAAGSKSKARPTPGWAVAHASSPADTARTGGAG